MRFLYVMDPMCSWCWAFAPVIDQLHSTYPDIPLDTVMGGLAPDSDAPMPPDLQQMISTTWRRIEQQTGTRFNHTFWQNCTPRRSTYPACRAVISAEQQIAGSSKAMIRAIQQAYYLQAKNPSDADTLIQLAESLGLDRAAFTTQLYSEETEQLLQQHLALAAQIGASGFPSLYLATDDDKLIPISLGYSDWTQIQKNLGRYLGQEK